MAHNKPKAFTLVELLVVVGILSVLAALLLPAMENALEDARKMDCANRMRQLMIVSLEYENVYKVILPPALGCKADGTRSWGVNLLWDAGLLDPSAIIPFDSSDSATPTPREPFRSIELLRASSLVLCPSGNYGGSRSGTTQIVAARANYYDGFASSPMNSSLSFLRVRDGMVHWGEDRSKTFSKPWWGVWGGYPAWNPSPNRNGAITWGTPISYRMTQGLSSVPINVWPIDATVWKPIRSYSGAPSRKLVFLEACAYWGNPIEISWWGAQHASVGNPWFQPRHNGAMNYSCHDGHVTSLSGDPETCWFDIDRSALSSVNPGVNTGAPFIF